MNTVKDHDLVVLGGKAVKVLAWTLAVEGSRMDANQANGKMVVAI